MRGDTVMVLLTIRYNESSDQWWALNKRDSGFASFGYSFNYLGDLIDHFRAELVTFGTDRHGLYLVGRYGVTL